MLFASSPLRTRRRMNASCPGFQFVGRVAVAVVVGGRGGAGEKLEVGGVDAEGMLASSFLPGRFVGVWCMLYGVWGVVGRSVGQPSV